MISSDSHEVGSRATATATITKIVEDQSDAEAYVQYVIWVVAGVFVGVAVVASIRLIRGHLNNFTKPIVQSKVSWLHGSCWRLSFLSTALTDDESCLQIVGILWMVPIYATDSWLSLRFKVCTRSVDWSSFPLGRAHEPFHLQQDSALYLDLLRDSYEGYVIYLFLALMIAYLGDGSNERVLQVRMLYRS
jgi:hypothetical protein